MKLIALFIAMLLERLATQLFHLRELRWLDGLFDYGLRLAQRFDAIPKLLGVVATILLVALPVILLRAGFGDSLLGLPYLALSVVVLFFSLGPRDIGEEVDQWCSAIEARDAERARSVARALLEHGAGDEEITGSFAVEEAVCIQANNRMFAVIFWFVVLGPVGAWVFRVADLLRRRAVFQAERLAVEGADVAEASDPVHRDLRAAAAARQATEQVHGLLAWLPARLTALGYALTGSFDSARHAWSALGIERLSLRHGNERLLATVGLGAMALTPVDGETPQERQIRGARAARILVFRTLVFWLVAIAAMTLAGAAI
jgi:AmpE protein